MSQVDPQTQAFMQAVAGEQKPEPQVVGEILQKASRTARGLARDPKKWAARKVVSMIVAPEAADKLGSVNLNILGLFGWLNEHYARDWWDWEPETLWQTFLKDRGLDVPHEMRNAILALQTVVATDSAFEHWNIFENVSHAFNGNAVDFNMLQPVELNEAAWTIYALKKLRNKDIDVEVSAYIAAIAKSSGVVYLPPQLFGGLHAPTQCLDQLSNDIELRGRVATRWPKPPVPEDDLPLKVQLLRLKEIADYIMEMARG